MKIFWSWQSDRSAALCRNLVQDALVRALDTLSDELELDPSQRPEVDHDTKGEAGMAAIADTIFEKIKAASAFVGDITSAARSDSGRELPNPNVLIELGWAWAHLGHEKIILVANKAFGPKRPEQLPFDLRHRRAVIFYTLAKGSDDAAIEAATAALSEDLAAALRTSLAEWLTAQADTPGPTGRESRADDPSVWFPEGATLSHQPFHGGAGLQSVTPESGARLYARIVPERFDTGTPTPLQVHEARIDGSRSLSPLGPCGSGDGGVNGDGVLRYAARHGGGGETWTAVQWFEDTGELWSFDTERLSGGRFHVAYFLKEASVFLRDGLDLLQRFGASGQIRIELGAVGLSGSLWAGQFTYEQSDALRDRVQVSQSRRSWSRDALVELLTAACDAFAKAYGRRAIAPAKIKAMIEHALGPETARSS